MWEELFDNIRHNHESGQCICVEGSMEARRNGYGDLRFKTTKVLPLPQALTQLIRHINIRVETQHLSKQWVTEIEQLLSTQINETNPVKLPMRWIFYDKEHSAQCASEKTIAIQQIDLLKRQEYVTIDVQLR